MICVTKDNKQISVIDIEISTNTLEKIISKTYDNIKYMNAKFTTPNYYDFDAYVCFDGNKIIFVCDNQGKLLVNRKPKLTQEELNYIRKIYKLI